MAMQWNLDYHKTVWFHKGIVGGALPKPLHTNENHMTISDLFNITTEMLELDDGALYRIPEEPYEAMMPGKQKEIASTNWEKAPSVSEKDTTELTNLKESTEVNEIPLDRVGEECHDHISNMMTKHKRI